MKNNLFLKGSLLILLFSMTQCNQDDQCEGSPKMQCYCPQVVDPVCGCNKKTYPSACEAECDGISIYTAGACK